MAAACTYANPTFIVTYPHDANTIDKQTYTKYANKTLSDIALDKEV